MLPPSFCVAALWLSATQGRCNLHSLCGLSDCRILSSEQNDCHDVLVLMITVEYEIESTLLKEVI